MLRFIVKPICKLLTKFFYRVEVSGIENFKKVEKKCIIIANHQSLLDAALMELYLPKRPFFTIDASWAEKWWVKYFFLKLVKVIKLNPFHPMAVKTLIKRVKEKDTRLLIFPEGRLSLTGHIMKMYDGAGMIAHFSGAPLLPVRIEGAEHAKLMTPYLKGRLKRRLFTKIKIKICPPEYLDCPEDIKGRKRRLIIRRHTQHLMSKMIVETQTQQNTIFAELLVAKKYYYSSDNILKDLTGPLRYKDLIKKSYVFANYLSKLKAKNNNIKNIGLLLPNLNATIINFLSCQLADLTPAMLNYSGGTKSVLDACKLAKITHIITHPLMVAKMKLEPLIDSIKKENIEVLYLDEIVDHIKSHKLKYGFTSKIKRRNKKKNKDPKSALKPACILFTSGSEGAPKGVVLSHKNILSNCTQLSICLDGYRQDVLFNSLPLFHAFGLVAGCLFPMLNGVRTYLYPSPLHYRLIPEYIYHENATIIFGTDTFLSGYARFANRYDFNQVRYVIAGGEKLKETTKQHYYDQFGLTIYEGYGATEMSPVISVNTPLMFKQGTVGKILPGIEHKLEKIPDLDTGKRLFLKGPTVMLGYYKIDNPGVLEPTPNGWYDTGDIVTIDEDSFITIQGRAKRFAKVAGEMLSLTYLEEVITELWPDNVSAILTTPDEKKGEALILVTDNEITKKPTDKTKALCREHLINKGLSLLYLPAQITYCKNIPLLSTGKINYPELDKIINKK